jgi:RNA polymerase sigma factor (sigma-70 family)
MRNDRTAQFTLYNLYSKKLFAVAYRYAQDMDMANDMLQEGFIRIFNHIHQFEFKGSFEGWMRRIIVNTSINYLEKHHKMRFENEDLLLVNDTAISPQILEELDCNDLFEIIKKLPPNYRTVLNMYAVDGYSYSEIAAITQTKEATVRSLYLRAKLKLSKLIEPEKKKEYHEKII